MNFWSHSSISVVFFRLSDSSSLVDGGSFLWCSHHSMTLRRTGSVTFNKGQKSQHGDSSRKMTCFRVELTLGIGTISLRTASPRSSSMFLMSIDRSATGLSAAHVSNDSHAPLAGGGWRRPEDRKREDNWARAQTYQFECDGHRCSAT